MMHVSYTGIARGATGRDIFYTRDTGAGWGPSVRVTQDTAHNCDEWYSDIAADRPDNVWVVWDRQYEGGDRFRVYAAHWDGERWSSEERLDSDTAGDYDNSPQTCLGYLGRPWVVWYGVPDGTNGDVFYNRWEGPGGLRGEPGACLEVASLAATSPASGRVILSVSVARAGRAKLRVYDSSGRLLERVVDQVLRAGSYVAFWTPRRDGRAHVPAGTYFACLDAAGISKRCKFVLLSR
jgi:hypothetical protein